MPAPPAVEPPASIFDNAAFIRECFALLGPHIKSCHAKDLLMKPEAGLHIYEVRPGLGDMDYRAFLFELSKLNPDIPLMIEHLQTEAEYAEAATHILQVQATL